MSAPGGDLIHGYHYQFVGLQIDIAGHSGLVDAERILHAAKNRFHNQITGIARTYGAFPLGWKGDGGAFLFHITDGSQNDEAVWAAFRILESLPGINAELAAVTHLSQSLAIRLSVDSGTAIYDSNPGLITGDFLNSFLKHERDISSLNTITVTERVHRQLSIPARGKLPVKLESTRMGCSLHRSTGDAAARANFL